MLIQEDFNNYNGVGQLYVEDVELVIDDDYSSEIYDGKFEAIGGILLYLIVFSGVIYDYSRYPGWEEYQQDKLYILFVIPFNYMVDSGIGNPLTALLDEMDPTKVNLEFENEFIGWEKIQEVYVTVMIDEEDDKEYSLSLKYENGVKSIPFDYHKSDVEDLLKEIGKFRWNWKRKNGKVSINQNTGAKFTRFEHQ